ncbi:putative F-box protein At3g52320 [Rutidosis leptorrhynchoides]|uniref:putative F-box protein At3g52320 n=1 Tax=Rutidosis leptorrhynchoides TaxID=125765 RepID=UPI003A9A176A
MNSHNASIQDLSDNHIVEILVKLPVKTIVPCKCVCRDWLNLITDSHFISLHLSKSAEYVMLFDLYIKDPITKPKSLRLVEIEEEHGRNHLHDDPIMCLDLKLAPVFRYANQLCVVGSVNGLICLAGNDYRRDKIYICNPMTREYMILSNRIDNTKSNFVNYYGFGVGSLSGEYKAKITCYLEPCHMLRFTLLALANGEVLLLVM